MTTIDQLIEVLDRLLCGEFVTPESAVYLISRDGEQLRPIVNLSFPARRLTFRECYLEGTWDTEGGTITVDELHRALRAVAPAKRGGRVRILADGFGGANYEDLEAVKMAPDFNGRDVDLAETDVVLCP